MENSETVLVTGGTGFWAGILLFVCFKKDIR